MKKLKFYFLIVLLAFSMHATIWAQAGDAAADSSMVVVSVGDASIEQEKIIVDQANKTNRITKEDQKLVYEMLELWANDFSFYRKYFIVDRGFSRNTNPAYSSISQVPGGTELRTNLFLLQSTFDKIENGSYRVEVKLTNARTGDLTLNYQQFFNPANLREIGHEIADLMYGKITGRKSIFKSFFVFVSDIAGNRRNPIKELYRMDFDGRNLKRLTHLNETVVSPAISNAKDRVAYSAITLRGKKRNIDLYEMELKTGKVKSISTLPGINSGVVYMPGDQEILLTLSFTGNAEIFSMDLNTKRLRNITRHSAEDVDPSISFDGRMMTFLSSRPGKAMIYTMDPSLTEKDVKRISFVGQFNATPRFSPDGKQIAFSSWVDERFDLYRIQADGTGLVRLTKDFGSNEDPSYSPDGEFIAFTSQRVLGRTKAEQNVYIMTKDGDILGSVTNKMGNCISPRWSN